MRGAAARCTTLGAGPTIHSPPSVSRTCRPRAWPHRARTIEHRGHTSPSRAFPRPRRVGLHREHRASERNHTALPHQPGQGHSGRTVPYPDPKIIGGGADQ
jgi:hypothetical protein